MKIFFKYGDIVTEKYWPFVYSRDIKINKRRR